MALNLIPLTTIEGKRVLLGIAQIASVEPRPLTGAMVTMTTGQVFEVESPVKEVSDLANRRPPDGN